MNSHKVLHFCCQDGSCYTLPLILVAEHRAIYYAAKDTNTTFKEEEIEFFMNDNYQGIDWFRNQCNPEEFSGHCKLVKSVPEQTIEQKISNCENIGLFDEQTGIFREVQ